MNEKPIVNRSDDRYSADMHKVETLPLPLVTTTFPAHWLHMNDDTPCAAPDLCEMVHGRSHYVRGGRPDEGQWAEREGWSGANLAE